MKAKLINLTHTRRRTITTKLSADKCLLMNLSEFNGFIYVNSIACYGPQYICKCKRHDKVRYECITNGLFDIGHRTHLLSSLCLRPQWVV